MLCVRLSQNESPRSTKQNCLHIHIGNQAQRISASVCTSKVLPHSTYQIECIIRQLLRKREIVRMGGNTEEDPESQRGDARKGKRQWASKKEATILTTAMKHLRCQMATKRVASLANHCLNTNVQCIMQQHQWEHKYRLTLQSESRFCNLGRSIEWCICQCETLISLAKD